MENTSKIIGANIRKYRIMRDMTREQLAEVLELDTAYLGQCERGERQLGLNKTIELMEYFGVTADKIIPVNIKHSHQNQITYLRQINTLLNDCSDNQLLAILRYIKVMSPFFKE